MPITKIQANDIARRGEKGAILLAELGEIIGMPDMVDRIMSPEQLQRYQFAQLFRFSEEELRAHPNTRALLDGLVEKGIPLEDAKKRLGYNDANIDADFDGNVVKEINQYLKDDLVTNIIWGIPDESPIVVFDQASLKLRRYGLDDNGQWLLLLDKTGLDNALAQKPQKPHRVLCVSRLINTH